MKSLISPERTCDTCDYWRRKEQTKEGECRRNPPQFFMGRTYSYSKFPFIYENDWCGEWKRDTGRRK